LQYIPDNPVSTFFCNEVIFFSEMMVLSLFCFLFTVEDAEGSFPPLCFEAPLRLFPPYQDLKSLFQCLGTTLPPSLSPSLLPLDVSGEPILTRKSVPDGSTFKEEKWSLYA